MSQAATAGRTCDERICVDTDTRAVLFPSGVERHYCRAHLLTVVDNTEAEVITSA